MSARLNEAETLLSRGLYEQALELFRLEEGAEAAFGLGMCCYRLGRLEEAKEALKRCLLLDPLNTQAERLLGRLTDSPRSQLEVGTVFDDDLLGIDSSLSDSKGMGFSSSEHTGLKIVLKLALVGLTLVALGLGAGLVLDWEQVFTVSTPPSTEGARPVAPEQAPVSSSPEQKLGEKQGESSGDPGLQDQTADEGTVDVVIPPTSTPTPSPSPSPSPSPIPQLQVGRAGPWEFTVQSFQTTITYKVDRSTYQFKMRMKKDYKNRIGVVILKCRFYRGYSDDEFKQIMASEAGGVLLSENVNPSIMKFLANPLFWLGFLEEDTADLSLEPCCHLMAIHGSVDSLEILNLEEYDFPLTFLIAKSDEITLRLVFPYKLEERNPILVFRPILGSREIMAARLTLTYDHKLAGAEYGDFAEIVTKYIPEGALPTGGLQTSLGLIASSQSNETSFGFNASHQKTCTVPATRQQMRIIHSLPEDLVYLTSAKNPIRYLEGIQDEEFLACVDSIGIVRKLLTAFGRKNTAEGIRNIDSPHGQGGFNKDPQLKLIITHERYAQHFLHLGGIRIAFELSAPMDPDKAGQK